MMTTPGGYALPIYDGGKVIGCLVLADGREIPLISGYLGPAAQVRGVPRMNGNIKSHVESHVAVIMRKEGIAEATLYINKTPCLTIHPRSLGCHDALPHMLPEGARLRVLGPNAFDWVYMGLPDPLGRTITGL